MANAHLKYEIMWLKMIGFVSGKNGEDTMSVGVFTEDKSNFMVYFFLLSIVSILAYLVFHNKQKVSG